MKYYDDKKYMAIVSDLLAMPEIQKLSMYEQHHYASRLAHVIDVSYASYKLARMFGLDYTSVARAGILHDFYYYDWHADGMTMSEHARKHPVVALSNAKKVTHINNVEEDIILTHMYPVGNGPRPRYKESWLLDSVDDYLASKEGSFAKLSSLRSYLVPRNLSTSRQIGKNNVK